MTIVNLDMGIQQNCLRTKRKKMFIGKQALGKFTTSRPVLKKLPKNILQKIRK